MDRSTTFKPEVWNRITNNTGYDSGEMPYFVNKSYSYDFISALNKGKFVPGIFRCNPVEIYKHKIINSPFGYARVGPVGPSATVIETWGEIGGLASTLGSISSWHNPTVQTRQRDLAIIKAYAKVNSPDTFDGGVFLAELAETIHMLRNPLQGIVKLLRSRSFRDPRRLAKAGADTWMEFRYGVRPLVSDIATLSKAFRNKSYSLEKTLFTKRAATKEQIVTVPLDTSSTYAGYILMTAHERGIHTRTYTGGVSYFKKPGMPNRAYQLGVSVEHLPSILWEKVPLSFVADWFYSTGDWLRAIQPNPTVQILGGYVSCKTDSQIHLNIVKATYSGVTGYVSATCDYESRRLSRTCNPSLPALPVRKIEPLGLAKSIDSCILALQRIPTAWKQAIAPLFGRRR